MKKMIFKIASAMVLATNVAMAIPKGVQEARQAAISLLWLDRNHEAWRAICSGSFIKINGQTYVLTAGHCVDEFPNGSYGAVMSNDDTVDLKLESYSFAWPIADYALFKVVDKDLEAIKNIKPLNVGTLLHTIGEQVFMWSGPLGTRINYYEGYYSGKMGFADSPSEIDDMDWVVISATFGSSGTVVLNADGEAVGVLVGGFDGLVGTFLAELPTE